jgi:hypothetical protein
MAEDKERATIVKTNPGLEPKPVAKEDCVQIRVKNNGVYSRSYTRNSRPNKRIGEE